MSEASDHAISQSALERKLWPKTLTEMIDVCNTTLTRNGLEHQLAEKLALRVVIELCQLFGGRPTYLPRGERIKNLARELDVYSAVNGKRSIADVARDFGLSVNSVYRICERVRQRRKA